MSNGLSYYKSLRYKMVWEYDKDDGVYFVKFPELSGCLAHGGTEQEALRAALEVKDEWLEAAYTAGWEIPEPSVASETTGRVTLRLPKYLHQKVIDKAEEEGVSQNQLILSFVAQGLEKARTEDLLKEIAATQHELVGFLKSVQAVENLQPTRAPFSPYGFLNNMPFYTPGEPNHMLNPYSSVLDCSPATISAYVAVTTESNYFHKAVMMGEEKDRLRLVISRPTRASEEGYKGGYVNEA